MTIRHFDTSSSRRCSRQNRVTELGAAGVPGGRIYAIDQVFADEQVRHLCIAEDVPITKTARPPGLPSPFTLSRTRARWPARRPEIGEQTDELLGRIGFSAEEIAPLRLSTGILKGSAQRHPLDRALPRSHRVA